MKIKGTKAKTKDKNENESDKMKRKMKQWEKGSENDRNEKTNHKERIKQS